MSFNIRLMKETFYSLAEHGIDPNSFVEWYFDKGIFLEETEQINESCENWLEMHVENARSWGGAAVGGIVGGILGGPLGAVAGAALGSKAKSYKPWAAQAVQGTKNYFSRQGAEQDYENIRDPKSTDEAQKFKKIAFQAQRAISNFLNRVDNSLELRLKLKSKNFDKTLQNLKYQLANLNFVENKNNQNRNSSLELLNDSVLNLKIENELSKSLRECKKLNINVHKVLQEFRQTYIHETFSEITLESFENESNKASLSYVIKNLEDLEKELGVALTYGVKIKKDFMSYLQKAIFLSKKLQDDLTLGTNNFATANIDDKSTRLSTYRAKAALVFPIEPQSFNQGDIIMINPVVFLFLNKNEIIFDSVDRFLASQVKKISEEDTYDRETGNMNKIKYVRVEDNKGQSYGLPLDYFVLANDTNKKEIKDKIEQIINVEFSEAGSKKKKDWLQKVKTAIETKLGELVSAAKKAGMP